MSNIDAEYLNYSTKQYGNIHRMKDAKKYNKTYVYIASFILVMLISFGYKTFLNMRADGMVIHKESEPLVADTATIASNSSLVITDTSFETTINTISVYICGEVNSPGVYEINEGSILNEVIILAGGFTEEAASNYINLVYELTENVSIYIPKTNEVGTASGFGDNVIRGNDSLYIWGNEDISSTDTSNSGESLNEDKININTAPLEVLVTLPGIGEATAHSIIDYRSVNPFITIEDIMNVTGIGESKFNRIREYICV